MADLTHKMPGKALFVYSMCLLSLIPIIKANPTFRSINCQKTTNTSATDNNYLANLNFLPDGSSPPDVAFNSSNSTVSSPPASSNSTVAPCLDGGDEGGYVNPPDLYSGCGPSPVFGWDFWKVEISTVADPSPSEAGFVSARSDPVVGKSRRF